MPPNALYLTTVMLLFSLVMLYAGSGIMEGVHRGDLRGVDDGYLHLEHDPDCVPGVPQRSSPNATKHPHTRCLGYWHELVSGLFAVMVYALSLYPDTAIGLALTPLWFIAWLLATKILTRHAAKRAHWLLTRLVRSSSLFFLWCSGSAGV